MKWLKNSGINPIYLSAPYSVSYCNNFIEHQTFNTKPYLPKLFSIWLCGDWKEIPRINPTRLSAPWYFSYSPKCLEPPNFNYQTFSSNISLKLVNKFIMVGVTTKPAPLPQPSTIIQGKQILMSGLYTDHRQF